MELEGVKAVFRKEVTKPAHRDGEIAEQTLYLALYPTEELYNRFEDYFREIERRTKQIAGSETHAGEEIVLSQGVLVVRVRHVSPSAAGRESIVALDVTSPPHTTKPVLTMVSTATRDFGS